MAELIKILIVEDVRIVALDLKKRLVKLGYDVVGVVSTGEAAVERVEETPVDLILMDITLEGEIDGIEAATRIKSCFDIPVIYLTAHSDKKTLARAKVTDPFGYIVKPFDKATLHASIEMAVYKHRMKKKLEAAEAERDRLLAQREHARKMEALGTLAGGVAHHINNLLAVIIGFTELAMSELPPETPAYSQLEKAVQGGLRARDVVRQILIFSNPGGKDLQPVRIGPIIAESLRFLQSSLPSTIDIRENITTESDVAAADPSQINQVLINLCTNAVDAMKEQGGILEVILEEVALEEAAAVPDPDLQPGRFLRLTVGDTGRGMPPEVVKRVFDPFFTTRDVGEGTGMGLAVVHGIVKNHGGAVTVQSEPGKGSVFQVYLPKSE